MKWLRVCDVRRQVGEYAELSARVEGLPRGLGEERLWFRVAAEYESWVSEGAEPFVAALLPVAMVLGRRLAVAGASVSPLFLHGCGQIARLYHRWDSRLVPAPVDAAPRAGKEPRGTAVGCFFTGGVDSSYTLLKNLDREHGDSRISHLIFVRGYADCPMGNAPLFENLASRLERVAAELELGFIAASTNLREFTPPPGPGWDKFAGSQLASVGLLLSRGLRRVYIPAGDTYATLSPWGSHPQIDPLWSSETLEFRHDGCEAYRSQKLEWYVGSSRTIMENLRVCGYEQSGLRNCGTCEKCLRTMIGLTALGVEIPKGLFSEELDRGRIRNLDGGDRVIRYYLRDNLRLLAERGQAPALEAAVRDALRPNAARWLRRHLYAAAREVDRRWLHGRLRAAALRIAGRSAQDQAALRTRPVRYLIGESWKALSALGSRLVARPADWRYRGLLLAARVWRMLLVRTTVVAVTGSLGKTTAKEMLAAMLGELGPVLATPSTFNSVQSVARTILRARPWHRFLVLETGTDRPGWMRRSAFICRPDIAVVLNVAQTHIRAFATLEETAREKACLLDGLGRRGRAVLNRDDARVAAMAAGRKGRVVWYGAGEGAEVRAEDVSAAWPQRLAVTLRARGASERVQTRLVGAHWVNSVLGAAAAALECGASLPQIAAALARVEPTPGRLDPRVLPSGAVMLRDDFNGSLEGFRAAFEVLRNARAGRKILAITSVSESRESWSARLRRIAGEAAQAADVLVLIGEPNDTRKPAEAALAGGIAAERLHRCDSPAAAAAFLRSYLREGDLVLLRGTTSDHLARVFHAQTHEVRCWSDACRKTSLCDDCPELFGAGEPRGEEGPDVRSVRVCVR